MGIKMRALRLSQPRSQMQQAYLGDAMTLSNVPCEVIYKAEKMFVEHEGPEHHYLPLIHLTGTVLEAKGSFPFNVSTLYFTDDDARAISSDILYFPRPEELAHMIQTGRFFTKQFELPDVLSKNTYSFPALLNLKVVPPYDPAGYEAATYSGTKLAEWENLGIDKDNLPIFYADIIGTGVSRETDKLLDYYGIDFDEDYPVFAMTADSSGYVTPPLMMYIPEPVDQVEEVQEDVSDMYLTEEDEAKMIQQQQATEEQAVSYEEMIHRDDAALDHESALLAERDSAIARRIEEIRSKKKVLEDAKKQALKEDVVARSHEHPVKGPKRIEKEQVAEAQKQSEGDIFIPDMEQESDSYNRALSHDDYVDEPFVPAKIEDEVPAGVDVTAETPVLKDKDRTPAPAADHRVSYGGNVEDILRKAQAAAQAQLNAAKAATVKAPEPVYSEVASADDFLDQPDAKKPLQVQIGEGKKAPTQQAQPDVREKYKQVEMDLNPERNENVAKARAEDVGPDQGVQAAQKANGADVADAAEQVVVDDAALTEEVQRQIRQQGRKVTDGMEDVAKKAQQAGSDEYLGVSY